MSILGAFKKSVFTRIGRALRRYELHIDQVALPAFANAPRNLRIRSPWRITNPECMHLGDDVDLGPGCFLNAIKAYPPQSWSDAYGVAQQRFSPIIRIGNRVSATGNLTIAACAEITVEDDVLMASNINITDAFHGYSNVDVPFKFQPMERPGRIRIGRGSWIGQNCVIVPGVTIGEFAIVGANSVVNTDIPDRCIAVGAPARVIKTWDQEAGGWKSAR